MFQNALIWDSDIAVSPHSVKRLLGSDLNVHNLMQYSTLPRGELQLK